jgi:hypothetical protein
MQNHFEFTKREGTGEPQKVEITISEAIHDIIMEPIKQRWLLPVLQGERKDAGNGMTTYCFYLPDEDAELLRSAIFTVYIKLSGYSTSN